MGKGSMNNIEAALYSLWFGLDYGSILTAYSLYKVVEKSGAKPYLLQKLPELWSDHYADKDNIAGKFIYDNCDVLNVFDNEKDKEKYDSIPLHITGSDIIWNAAVVGDQAGLYYFCDTAPENSTRIAFGSSFGNFFPATENALNRHGMLLKKFKGISVKESDDVDIMNSIFGIVPEFVVDPVFLCDKQNFIDAADKSAAKQVEKAERFIWSYVKNGDKRKKEFLLRGNNILLEKYTCPLRNFIDINRFPESQKALDLEPAYHILVNDWLYYLINSEFVITDDYYGMCFALMFKKPFVVMVQKDMPDLARYVSLLEQLELEERMVFMTDDFRTKEYLFRKPVRYNKIGARLDMLCENSLKWLKDNMNTDINVNN